MKLEQNELQNQTFGVEVEMNHITRDCACSAVASYFGTNDCHYVGEGYYTWSCTDTKGRTWKFQRDVSIAGDDTHKCEMVTPILRYDDMDDLQNIIRLLRHEGAKSSPSQGCGVHIHVGADGHTPQTLRNLANIMASHERLLVNALNLSSYRVCNYCKPVSPAFLDAINAVKPTTMQRLSDLWYKAHNASHDRDRHYNLSRYHMLNLHATFTKGTIEFRLFQFDDPSNGKANGLHAGQLKSYIQLCLALCAQAKAIKYASPKEVQHENEKYAMRCWLLRLGFIGDEFATARNILTSRLTGDAAFRNGREAV